jgi:hypothetical protein
VYKNKSTFYGLTAILIIILSSSILLTSIITIPHQAFARCPSGTHKSPSSSCEAVVPHTGLPRCPSGSHRSPSGVCEQVSSSGSNNDGITSSGENNNINNLSSATTSSSSNQCDESLWNHVYNPQRLQVVEPCKTVLGIIESKGVEADGDFHIRLKLDSQFANLINQANVNGQLGDLVVEPICMNPVKQQDAVSACQNFHQALNIPPVGSHVQVTGSYVLDKEHGSWAEIHPVTSISLIS